MEPALLTALPYVDIEAGPEVQRLIDEEMRRFTPPDYLAGRATATLTFEYGRVIIEKRTLEGKARASEMLRQEWARLEASQGQGKLRALDLTRYAVPPPPPADTKSLAAWEAAVNNAKAALTMQTIHVENLELLKLYGANAWRDYNERLEKVRVRLQGEVSEAQKTLDRFNLERKNEQVPVGRKLAQMEAEWADLVQRNRSLATAISNLEQELVTLQRTTVSS